MNYAQTLEYLYNRLPMFQRIGAPALKYSLDNIKLLMEVLGNPHHDTKFIHVAGTNGKGSSSHMIASILQEAGYKVGLNTSPHLKSFTERIRINGVEIEEQAVVDFVDKIKNHIEIIKPSFFEIGFAMALCYFKDKKVDFAVIEVGMGGRLDSSNIINPLIALITNISFDHQQFLGSTLQAIATEKAGIIKPNIPVVISETQEEVAAVFRNTATKNEAAIIFADKHYLVEQASPERVNIIYQKEVLFEGLLPELKGPYQVKNLPGVLATIEELRKMKLLTVSLKQIKEGIQKTVSNTGLKGRWQILNNLPLTIADTGHNKAGVTEIVNQLNLTKYDKLHMVVGMVSDKEIEDVLKLLPQQATYYFVNAKVPRAMPSVELKELAKKSGLFGMSYSTVMAGYNAALANATKKDMIFIGGSTFVVAEIDEL